MGRGPVDPRQNLFLVQGEESPSVRSILPLRQDRQLGPAVPTGPPHTHTHTHTHSTQPQSLKETEPNCKQVSPARLKDAVVFLMTLPHFLNSGLTFKGPIMEVK